MQLLLRSLQEHHLSAAGHTKRDEGAVRILIIEINCMLFQLIVPISLSFFSVMPFCNSVIWDAVRN